MAARGRVPGRKPLEARILEIGPRLKDARKKATLPLRVLAARTGFSASFLSQVERGQVSPSLSSLEKIAEALGMQLAGLFANAGSPASPVVHRHDEGVVRSGWSRATLRVLLRHGRGSRSPRCSSRSSPEARVASRRARGRAAPSDSVSRARAVLETPDETFELSRGDSICYETSGLASIWRNAGSRTAEILIVSLPA